MFKEWADPVGGYTANSIGFFEIAWTIIFTSSVILIGYLSLLDFRKNGREFSWLLLLGWSIPFQILYLPRCWFQLISLPATLTAIVLLCGKRKLLRLPSVFSVV
ncbi:MAG: hypothetical protein ACREJQ_04960, partial [bacterium]